MSELSIIIVNYKTQDLTLQCLSSIFSKKWKVKINIWLVDNASEDGSTAAIKKRFPQVNIIESKTNLGFAGGNNLGLKKAKSEYYLLLNSDTKVKPGSLDNLVDVARKEGFDIVSCKLEDTNGSFQPNAGELPYFFPMFLWISGLDDILGKVLRLASYQAQNKDYYNDTRKVGWVSGSVMLINDKVLKKIGFLDEDIFMYGEDVEFCLRANRAGFKVGWTDKAEVVHLGGGSSVTPKLNQWTGEFKGLLYIYKKYYGLPATYFLRLLMYIFIAIRAICFLIKGKPGYTRTYAKIITKI